MLLLLAAVLLGLMSYFFTEKKHRRAFLETRQSLEVKMVIEEQSREQVGVVGGWERHAMVKITALIVNLIYLG